MAYYSNQGAQIYSGAAGLGQAGPLRAFKEGSLGRSHNWGRSPMAYQDGSLGASWGRSPMAFQDGSLGGQGYGPREAFKDGSLGQSGSGPLMSFQDGSLGNPLFLETKQGIQQLEDPVILRHGAMGEYFSGMAGCRGCGATAAEGLVLDMSSAATAKEVKKGLFAAPWMQSQSAVPEAVADLEDPVWTTMTVQTIGAWISGYIDFLFAQPTPPAMTKVEFLDKLQAEGFEGEFFVPTAVGIRHIYFGAALGATSANQNPAESFPIMTKFLTEETASGTEGSVLPPAIEGQGTGLKGSNMMFLGAGMLALAVGFAVVIGGKKKRR